MAHWTAGLCTRTCETGQTTLPHHDSAQGRPTHSLSLRVPDGLSRQHPCCIPVWGIVPPLGALNWWSRTSAQLATSPCNYTLNSGKTLDRWAKSILFLVSPLLRQNQQVQPSSRRSILIPSGPAEILTIGNNFSIIVSEIWGLLRGAGFSRRPEIPQHAGCPLGLARSMFVVAVVHYCLCPLPDYQHDLPCNWKADGSFCTSCSPPPLQPIEWPDYQCGILQADPGRRK